MLKFEWTKEHTVALIYTCVTILLAIPLVLVILFPDILGGALGGLVDALSPVLIGFAVAYLLFPVCDFFEKKVCGFIEKKKPRPRLRRSGADAACRDGVSRLLCLDARAADQSQLSESGSHL